MKVEIEIVVNGLKLDQNQVREIFKLGSINDFEPIRVHSGLEYDSYIEEEGSNSESFLTTIKFCCDDSTYPIEHFADMIISFLESKYPVVEEGKVCWSYTDVNNIVQYH